MNSVQVSANTNSPSLPKVLVIEDDLCAAHLYKILLQREGYEVAHSPDGEAALQLFAREKFDAVVLDLMMPKVDGMQVLKTIRASSENPLVPVIILTAARLKVVEEEAVRLGARLFLDKTQSDKLLDELRKIMSERAEIGVRTLRMAPPSPIHEALGRRPPRKTCLPEPSKKAAAPTGLGWFFRPRNLPD